jgi:hypothetical protein
MEHIRKSRLDSGVGLSHLQANVLKTLVIVGYSLEKAALFAKSFSQVGCQNGSAHGHTLTYGHKLALTVLGVSCSLGYAPHRIAVGVLYKK